ncbi:MAG: TonB-dependent receptor plug domain-containing protein [Thalassotalea sp.]
MTIHLKTSSLALAITAALGASSMTASAAKASVEQVERIAVVGSRAAPRSIADSPVPIDIIGANELVKNASVDILDQLQAAVPSFSVRQQPISDAATLIRPVNLRGLSSDSTLVLLNGKRRHRASVIAFQGGGVNDGAQGPDISVIPSIALKQVEVLRDGAAAQYGSDAIAGVMNFVLKDDADGGSMSVRHGSYYEGDGDTTTFDGNVGLPFTQNGFVNLSMQYKSADATSRSVQRPDAQALFDAGNTAIVSPAQVWGNPKIDDDITLFANVGLDLGNDKEFYLFGNYSERDVTGGFYYRNPHTRGNVYKGLYRTVNNVEIREPVKDDFPVLWQQWDDAPNTLLVGDLTADMSGNCPTDILTGDNVLDNPRYVSEVANNPDCFSFNETNPGGYTPEFGGNITDTSIVIGTKGEIKSGFLKDALYDISGSVGRNESKFFLGNTINPSMGPDSPNFFNTGKYIQLEKAFNFDLTQQVDVGLLDPMNLATGVEWREDSFEIISGEEASWVKGRLAAQEFVAGSHGFAGFSPESQGENVRRSFAAYIDVEAYITEKFLLGAALRYEDYSTFGDTTNYKITGQYTLNDQISLRGSHSTGFRAPTVGQENVVNTQTTNYNNNLVQAATYPPSHPVSTYYGGVALQPEESESFAVGLVYQNDDFFLTADFYNIEVTDRIAQTSKIEVLPSDYDGLRNAGVEFPETLDLVTFFANDFDTTTKGLDVVANYGMALLGGDTRISVAYNYNATSVDNAGQYTSDFKIRRLEESIPEQRGTLTLAQSYDEVSMFVRINYFGEYFAVHADENDPAWSETADSAITLDAEVSYFATDQLTLSAGANNLLDQEAHKLQKGGAYGAIGGTHYEGSPFDYNGGFYYVRAAYNF